ncbi:MAG: carbohydrate-binding domain-containing protein [Oscillospiraceae bacterium]|nr:carbohydrate-binding domain-containing protein [Oscillospiraceae bacterium]
MRKRFHGILAVLLAGAVLTACASPSASAAGGSEKETATAQTAALSAAAAEDEILISLSDRGTKVTGDGVSVDGSTVTITQEGTYRLTGTLSDGQIVVDADQEAKVKLILDGVSITKTGSAAVYALSADKVILYAAAESENELRALGEFVQSDDNNVDAAVFAKCDLNLNGEGAVEISSESGHGVVSKDDLKVKGGTWDITAAGKGLSGKDSVIIEDGAVSIFSGTKGIWSGNEDDSEKGVIEISGGTVSVTAQDDGVHSDNTVTVSGGELTVASGDDGIHADNTLTISGGSVDVTKSYEGLETNDILISGGSVQIVASDDGVNAAGGNDGSNAFGPFGGDPFGSDSGSTLTISGGTVVVDAGGDGLDANGELIVSGGEIYVNGPTNNGNGALDYGTGASISGGTVIAVGASGMAVNFGSGSTQGSILLNLSTAQAAGTTVSVADESGKVLASFTPSKSYQSVVISTAGLEQGGTYTVTAGTVSETVTLSSITYGNGGMGGFGGPGMGGGPGMDGDQFDRQDGGYGGRPGGPGMGGGFRR